MDFVLDPVEARVLGCLIEKDITTPEYYPLTLNALVNACNQKSNRDPIVAWNDHVVAEAVDSLRDKRLLGVLTGGGNRVPKYSHRLQEVLNLGRREIALICELLVRGPQTLNELRERGSRMCRFSDLDEVESCLGRLGEYAGGALVKQLPRQPGQKELRFAHLLAGEPLLPALAEHASAPRTPGSLEGRVAALESEVADLRIQMDALKRELGLP